MWLNQVKNFQVEHNIQEKTKQVDCLTRHKDLVSKNHIRSTSSNPIRVSRQESSMGGFMKMANKLLKLISLLSEVRTPYNLYLIYCNIRSYLLD